MEVPVIRASPTKSVHPPFTIANARNTVIGGTVAGHAPTIGAAARHPSAIDTIPRHANIVTCAVAPHANAASAAAIHAYRAVAAIGDTPQPNAIAGCAF